MRRLTELAQSILLWFATLVSLGLLPIVLGAVAKVLYLLFEFGWELI